MFNKKEYIMIKFNKTDIELVNDLWSILSRSDDDYLWYDSKNITCKKELKGWVLYELENNPDLYFKDLDILQQALYIKNGGKKYGK